MAQLCSSSAWQPPSRRRAASPAKQVDVCVIDVGADGVVAPPLITVCRRVPDGRHRGGQLHCSPAPRSAALSGRLKFELITTLLLSDRCIVVDAGDVLVSVVVGDVIVIVMSRGGFICAVLRAIADD